MTAARHGYGAICENGTEILFCRIDDDQAVPLDKARGWLCEAERSRSDQFLYPRDRVRFVRGRGFLRRELADRLGCDPRDVRLAEGPAGKPFLIEGGPCFNLSHSGGLAALALSDTHDVGLDIELADGDPRGAGGTDSLIDLCFCHHEAVAICAAPDRDACFLHFWTAKEARMKLTGEGMRLEPRSIVLELHGGRATGYLRPSPPRAVLWAFEHYGAIGCVATTSGPV